MSFLPSTFRNAPHVLVLGDIDGLEVGTLLPCACCNSDVPSFERVCPECGGLADAETIACPGCEDGTEPAPTAYRLPPWEDGPRQACRRCDGRREVEAPFRGERDEAMMRASADDPIGPKNQEFVWRASTRAGIIVCAWGAHGVYLGQDETVLGWIDEAPRYALGLSRDGHPRHPLYLKGDRAPFPWEGR